MRKIEPLEVDEPSVLKAPNILEKVLSLVFGEGTFEVSQDISPAQTPEEKLWTGAHHAPSREEMELMGTEEVSYEDSGIERPKNDGVFGWRREDDDESVAW